MYDIAIIGGGINGCGIARDAAGRGLSVLLAEKDDLASGTSSWSTKLIHGGLRYLEHYEFRLVREALTEREVLWTMAPHIIQPARFVLPHHRGLRPQWLLRLGLFLYDHIGGRKKLPATRRLNLSRDSIGKVLKDELTTGFEFSDCRVDDVRLTVLNARDAADRGADIHTRMPVVSARRGIDCWELKLRDAHTGKTTSAKARVLINAAGPWIDGVLRDVLGNTGGPNIRLVKGSHIVVPKLYNDERAFIFQNADGRVVFAIPYETDFMLIGTTDVDHEGDPGDAAISPQEIRYLCDTVNGYFRKPLSPDQIVWSFVGVRPLYDDNVTLAQEATRDYVIKTERGSDDLLLINIFGGKLTTYRRLAEEVVETAQDALGRGTMPWTANSHLPGGDFPAGQLDALTVDVQRSYPWLDPAHARRFVLTYGTRVSDILSDTNSAEALGEHFGHGLYECELRYLTTQEWAQTAEDVLWRRTKLGLKFSGKERNRLQQRMRKSEKHLARG